MTSNIIMTSINNTINKSGFDKQYIPGICNIANDFPAIFEELKFNYNGFSYEMKNAVEYVINYNGFKIVFLYVHSDYRYPDVTLNGNVNEFATALFNI